MAWQVPWFWWKQAYDLHSVTFRVFFLVSSCWLSDQMGFYWRKQNKRPKKKASLDWEWWSGNVSAWMDGKRLSPSHNRWPIGSHLSRVWPRTDWWLNDGFVDSLRSSIGFVNTLFPKLYRHVAVFDQFRYTMQIVHVIYVSITASTHHFLISWCTSRNYRENIISKMHK